LSDYISDSDITDVVVNQFTLTDYITESTYQLNDIAEKRGVDSDDIDMDDPHWKLKRYAVAYVCMRVCQDKMGVNNSELPAELEKYAVKYKLYKELCDEIEPNLTSSMFANNVDDIQDRVMTGRMFRG